MNGNSMSPKVRSLASAILALLASVPFAFAQEHAQGPHTVVTLISERRSLVPGSRVWMGVWFRVEKGWHIYWKNPGDSGEPAKIQWELPPRFHVGSIEWPAPERLAAPSIVDYGYENEAVLIAPMRVAAGLKNGEKETIAANVNWLVCREICIPGKAQVSLTLPVSSVVRGWKGSASSADVAMLIGARAKVPKPLPATWKVSATAEKNDFVLTIETRKPERAATFFPLEPEQIKNDATQLATPFSRGVRLRLQKSDGLLKPIAQLRGVLELGAGTGRAYQIAVPVRAVAAENR